MELTRLLSQVGGYLDQGLQSGNGSVAPPRADELVGSLSPVLAHAPVERT